MDPLEYVNELIVNYNKYIEEYSIMTNEPSKYVSRVYKACLNDLEYVKMLLENQRNNL